MHAERERAERRTSEGFSLATEQAFTAVGVSLSRLPGHIGCGRGAWTLRNTHSNSVRLMKEMTTLLRDVYISRIVSCISIKKHDDNCSVIDRDDVSSDISRYICSENLMLKARYVDQGVVNEGANIHVI